MNLAGAPGAADPPGAASCCRRSPTRSASRSSARDWPSRRRDARAEERARLAREIHDTLAQGLTAIALHIEAALNVSTRRSGARAAGARVERRARTSKRRRSIGDLRATPLGSRSPKRSAPGTHLHLRDGRPRARDRRRRPAAADVSPSCTASPGSADQRPQARARASVAEPETARPPAPDGCRRRPGLPPRDPQPRVRLVGMRERARPLGGRLRSGARPGRGIT